MGGEGGLRHIEGESRIGGCFNLIISSPYAKKTNKQTAQQLKTTQKNLAKQNLLIDFLAPDFIMIRQIPRQLLN